MRKTLSLLAVILALSGCRGMALGPPAPTPTALALPPPAKTGGTAERAPTSAGLPIATTQSLTPTETPLSSVPAPGLVPATAAPQATAPARLMSIGIQSSLLLRASPAATGSGGAAVAGSTVLWAEGRTADGKWLLETYGQPPRKAWAQRADVTVFGDPARLPVADAAAAQRPATAGLAAVSGSAEGPATLAGSALSGRVAGERLNVRRGPGVDLPVVAGLAAGDPVTLIARSTDGAWLQIAWPTGEAWVAARYIAVSGDASSLPATLAATSSVPAASAPAASAPAARAANVSGGRIAFETASGGDIYLMNADGSGLRRVASGLDPALSPDGSQLAYTRWNQGDSGVYLLDLATGQEQRVAGADRPRWPVWSPDGDRLVFSRLTGSEECVQTPLGCASEARIRDLLGGADCIDTPRGRFCIDDLPRVSQDFTGLSQLTLAGGATQDLAAQLLAQAPSWRPQSEQITYRGSKSLQNVTPQGDLQVFVDDTQVNSPAWSPDGKLMVAQKHLHDHEDLFLYDAAGQMQARLTETPFLADHAANNVSPAWSPDGHTILFFSDRDGSWRIYRMNVDGSGQGPFLPDILGSHTFRYDFAAEHMLTWGR